MPSCWFAVWVLVLLNAPNPCAGVPLKIGVLIPQTGWSSGRTITATIPLALEENSHLVPEFSFTYLIRDSGCNPVKAASAFLELAAEKVDIVIGPGCSAACEATNILAQHFGIAQLSFACSSPSLSNRALYPYFFRTVAKLSSIVTALTAVWRHYGWSKISLISTAEPYWSLSAQSIVVELNDAGIDASLDVVPSEHLFEHADDVLTPLGSKFAQFVLLMMGPADYVPFLRLVRDAGLLTHDWVWMVNCGSAADFPRGDITFNGVMSVCWEAPQGDRWADLQRNVRTRSATEFNYTIPNEEPIDIHSAFLYDAIHLYLHALRNVTDQGASPSDPRALFEAFKSIKFDGITREVVFNTQGDRLPFVGMSYYHASTTEANLTEFGSYNAATSTFGLHDKSVYWLGGSSEAPMDKDAPCRPGEGRILHRCSPCSPGYHNSGSDGNQECIPCPAGSEALDFGATVCTACLPGFFLMPGAEGSHCMKCPVGTYTEKTGSFNCTHCPTHSETNAEGSISVHNCTCDTGHFEMALTGGLECDPCPAGAYCLGGLTHPQSLKDWWAEPAYPMNFFQCNPQRCMGNNTCHEGYTGIMCEVCQDGYFMVSGFCTRCFSTPLAILVVILIIFGWVMLNRLAAGEFNSVDIFLFFCQLAQAVGSLKLDWPSQLSEFWGGLNIVNFDVDIMYPSCLLTWTSVQSFWLQILLPLIAFTLYACYAGLARICFALDGGGDDVSWLRKRLRLSEEGYRAEVDGCILGFLSLLDVSLHTIAYKSMSAYLCVQLHAATDDHFIPNLAMVCGTPEHRNMQIGAILGAVVVISTLVSFFGIVEYGKRNHLLHTPRFLARFGFMYSRYELPWVHWQTAFQFRRLAFMVVSLQFSTPIFQASLMMVIVVFSIAMHFYARPFVRTSLDYEDSVLLIALFSLLCAGMVFHVLSELDDDTASFAMGLMLFLTMFGLALVFVIAFVFIAHDLFLRARRRYAIAMFRARLGYKVEGLHDLLDSVNPILAARVTATCTDGALWEIGWLAHSLNGVVGDSSESSFLNNRGDNMWYHKLAKMMPEIIDLLLVSDDEEHLHIRQFLTDLQSVYCERKGVFSRWTRIVEEDRGPIVKWLLDQTSVHRRIFLRTMLLLESSRKTRFASLLGLRHLKMTDVFALSGLQHPDGMIKPPQAPADVLQRNAEQSVKERVQEGEEELLKNALARKASVKVTVDTLPDRLGSVVCPGDVCLDDDSLQNVLPGIFPSVTDAPTPHIAVDSDAPANAHLGPACSGLGNSGMATADTRALHVHALHPLGESGFSEHPTLTSPNRTSSAPQTAPRTPFSEPPCRTATQHQHMLNQIITNPSSEASSTLSDHVLSEATASGVKQSELVSRLEELENKYLQQQHLLESLEALGYQTQRRAEADGDLAEALRREASLSPGFDVRAQPAPPSLPYDNAMGLMRLPGVFDMCCARSSALPPPP